jgi:hypothetical protein
LGHPALQRADRQTEVLGQCQEEWGRSTIATTDRLRYG